MPQRPLAKEIRNHQDTLNEESCCHPFLIKEINCPLNRTPKTFEVSTTGSFRMKFIQLNLLLLLICKNIFFFQNPLSCNKSRPNRGRHCESVNSEISKNGGETSK
ncbi:hypothetical protein CEXT_475901 [Caerostris extrusa]|uniref:Transmembrane protein n=1 Tax=Caerostris extrusa TaxID=172846 RepID=A0AAV4T0W9_CAEEX|nr:hypothetical protein CEXT_475901 [Caerostris extrusa]